MPFGKPHRLYEVRFSPCENTGRCGTLTVQCTLNLKGSQTVDENRNNAGRVIEEEEKAVVGKREED